MSLPSTTLPDLIDRLLAPISADAPCGVDLRYDVSSTVARPAPRRRCHLPTGSGSRPLKRGIGPMSRTHPTLWLERSKDLMLSAWLGEAWLHLQALDGLPGSLALIAGLCERSPRLASARRGWRPVVAGYSAGMACASVQ